MMNDLNIEEYEKVKKPESYFVKYNRFVDFAQKQEVVLAFITKEEAEEYAKKIKYARKFLGDDLDSKYGKVIVGAFEDQFK